MTKPTSAALKKLWQDEFPNMLIQVDQFLRQSAPVGIIPAPAHTRRAWLMSKDENPAMKVFVRRACHAVQGQVLDNTFDVATIVFRYGRQGILTKFLDWCELEALQHGMSCVYIESVSDEWLGNWLVRRGYVLADQSVDHLSPPNYAITHAKMLERLRKLPANAPLLTAL